MKFHTNTQLAWKYPCVSMICCTLSEVQHFKAKTTLSGNRYTARNFRRIRKSVQIIPSNLYYIINFFEGNTKSLKRRLDLKRKSQTLSQRVNSFGGKSALI